MKRYALVLASLCLVATSFAGDLRSDIDATLKQVCAALYKRDAAAFEKALKPRCAKDCKFTENGQTMTLAQTVASMKTGMAQMKSVSKAEAKIISLKEKGNMATCVMSHKMAGKMTGPDKKSHSMGFSGNSTNTYKKVKGKWLMTSMV